MKKLLVISLLFISLNLFSLENRTSFSISGGTEFLNEFYMNFGFSILKPLENNMEIDIKAALNMRTQEVNSEITPLFNIPVRLNINFLFPINDNFTFLTGTGLVPTINLESNNQGFLMGPNFKIGFRYKLHPSMSLFLEASEAVLIGPPKWIYPCTEIITGINFYF